MTLVPEVLAFLAMGTIASALLGAMMMTSGFCATRSSIMRISSSVFATLGPRVEKVDGHALPFQLGHCLFGAFLSRGEVGRASEFGAHEDLEGLLRLAQGFVWLALIRHSSLLYFNVSLDQHSINKSERNAGTNVSFK